VDDESIVPKRNVTPLLRADATDDQDEMPQWERDLLNGEMPTIATGGTVKKGTVQVCPICGLESCGHNLAKITREAEE
jgi:hypothetical protein